MPDFVCLPSPSARLHFAYGTATLCDGGLLQFESSPIETTETLRLGAAWSVGSVLVQNGLLGCGELWAKVSGFRLIV